MGKDADSLWPETRGVKAHSICPPRPHSPQYFVALETNGMDYSHNARGNKFRGFLRSILGHTDRTETSPDPVASLVDSLEPDNARLEVSEI